jgi:enamine deaminase RidA (YjgF/YER057c/UK114 family)
LSTTINVQSGWPHDPSCSLRNHEKIMSRATKHLLIGGLIIMGLSTAAAASESKLTIVNPPDLGDPSPNGYSTAVIVPAGARIAYVSGQGGQDSTGGLSPDFAVQVKQAYANLRTSLDALGAKPNQVAKLTIFVVDHDMSKLGVLTRSVKEMFGEALPAQTLVPVPKLAVDPMLFEVEAVVVLE